MREEKVLKIDGFTIMCREFYGYNDHYYVTIYDNTNDSMDYMGQLTDCRVSNSDLERRVKKFVKENF